MVEEPNAAGWPSIRTDLVCSTQGAGYSQIRTPARSSSS